MLSIGSEDMPAYYTANAFAAGFKKSLAFQPHGIKQSRGSSGEGIRTTKQQPGSSCTSPDVEALMGSKDTLCKLVMLNIGLEDMLAHFTIAAGCKKMLAFQPRGIGQSRGSSGESIWITTRFGPWRTHFALEESAAGIKQSRGLMAFRRLLSLMPRYHLDEGHETPSAVAACTRSPVSLLTPLCPLMRFVKGSLRILFVTCHAPTATSPERDGWWKSFADLLLHTANGDKVVLLGDLNARLCEPLSGRVGELVWESEHRPPAPFFRVIRELDLWLPSTFHECHHGLSHTWSAPGGTSASRIDFILIPTGWWVPPDGSSVLYHVDFGQTGLDHFAVQLRISASFTAWLPFQARRLRFDSAKAIQPESAAAVQAIFDAAPLVPWEIDTHHHYHRVSSYLLDAFAVQFPVRKGARRRTFFSETTWSLRQQRVWLRKQAHIASANVTFTALCCAFQAWSSGVCLARAMLRQFSKALYNLSRLRSAVAELRHIRPAFRQSLRRDKGQYLSEVAAQAAVANTKDVVRRLRPLLGPPRRRQRGAASLPAVRLEDGTLATSPEEADARWLRHFSAAEHGGPIDPEVIQAFGLSPDHMHLLRAYVQERSLLVPAGASPWAANMVREFQEDSWLTVGCGLAVVESGTRPGDSLADITFSFLFASVLRRIRDAMLHSGYEVRLPWLDSWFRTLCPEDQPDEHLAPIDVSWMDDLALLLSASTPEALIEAARGSASVLIDECLKALLHPNLDPGKTEAILSLVGKGSRRLRIDLFRDPEPSLQLASTLWPKSRLRLVPKYTHLGGMLHFSGSLMPEVQVRGALAWKAFRKHRRLIFAAPTVTHREKSLLFNSLVLSSLLYGAGTWSVSDGAVPDKLQGILLAMARQMLRPTYSFEAACHLGARKILATARIPSAGVLLHIERLRHLAVVTRVAPKEFWAVLHYEAAWCRLAHLSIDWLRTMLEASGKAQPQLADWKFVLSTILDAPSTWKRWVNAARQTALLQELWEAEVQHYHGLLFRYLLAKGAIVQDLDVRSGRSCLAALVQQARFAEVAPGRGSRRFRDGRDALLPAVTASGPQQQWSADGYVPESDRADSSIIAGLSEIFCQPNAFLDFESLLQAIRRVFLRACLQKSRLYATAVEWKRLLDEELSAEEDFPLQWTAWHGRIADWLCQADYAAWLVPDAVDPEPASATFRDGALLLPWLSFDWLALPVCVEVLDLSLSVIGERNWLFGHKLRSEVSFLSHQSCIRSPSLLDFGHWISAWPPRVFGFCLLGLLPSLALPMPIKNYRSLSGHLGLAAVKKAALVTSRHDGIEIHSNFQVQDSLTGFGYTSVTKRMDIGSGGTWSISFAIGLCQGIGDDECNRPIDFCLLSSFLNHLGYALIVVFWDPGGFWHPAGLPTATWGTSNAAVGRSSAKCEGKLHRRCSGMLFSFVL
ncbi:unnamed protein product [Symbiodinium sp. KB8]|nr:unnamed protein product [Symbiodinium sp. KB8]